jgi:hypothetical protein
MRTSIISLIAAVVLLSGCATHNTVLVATGTVIGVEIGQNQTTGLYTAKLGYDRGEFAIIPSTNRYTPDVLVELHYKGIFSTGPDSGIYQRLAVGSVAVSQPGAMAMFLKDPAGNISSNTVSAIRSLSSVPTVSFSTTALLVPLASAYQASAQKELWDNVARTNGYVAFTDFLIDPKLTLSSVGTMSEALKKSNLIP